MVWEQKSVVERRRRMSAEENKAIFRRYVEEVGNEGKLELADEIFDRYLAHQPDVEAGFGRRAEGYTGVLRATLLRAKEM